MSEKKPLHIINFQAVNVKRITAVSITPKGHLIQITGKNAQGKSSVLDAIWWAIKGAKNIQVEPIRRGQEKARIRLDMGELVVTRTFKRKAKGDDYTTDVLVQNPDGSIHASPQKALDALGSALAMDPTEFLRKAPKARFDALRQFAAGIDFDAIKVAHDKDYAARTNLNRRIEELDARIAAIAIPETLPGERIDEGAIIDELADVGTFNAGITAQQSQRDAATKQAGERRDAAAAERLKADELIKRAEEEAARLRAEAESAVQRAAELERKAAETVHKLAEAEPLAQPKDQAAIRAKLDAAKATNAILDQVGRRDALKEEADGMARKARDLTKAIDERQEKKRADIAAAKMPVEGLGFADDDITFNGIPFDQASASERLRVAVAIAMASNPRLRVIRFSDGSLLDEDALKLIESMAVDGDYQVWMERVDSSGVGYRIEDGHVRSAPPADEPEVAAESAKDAEPQKDLL